MHDLGSSSFESTGSRTVRGRGSQTWSRSLAMTAYVSFACVGRFLTRGSLTFSIAARFGSSLRSTSQYSSVVRETKAVSRTQSSSIRWTWVRIRAQKSSGVRRSRFLASVCAATMAANLVPPLPA